ncbi:MAG: hypothetical protein OXL97_15650 [Chloroflexota bacterium]|nr:hypothetical protein [Chloroflexota bacterium]MDE2885958.1 hypothetical protein [Chloroflexota bacterium]
MSTLFIEAFGQLLPGGELIDSEEEDLYSVFRARAELMGWSTTSGRRSLLWEMEEAELTAGTKEARIGFVQVGLNVGDIEGVEVPPPPTSGFHYVPLGMRQRATEPAMVLPAVVQCFDDALRRFGEVELSGLQVTTLSLDPRTRSPADDLVSGLNWFNLSSSRRTTALMAFDQELLGNRTEAELVADLRLWNTGSFEFGPAVAVPEQHAVIASFESEPVSPARSGFGVSVTLPEWTASAVAWAIAIVMDRARAGAPDVSRFAVRVTRDG